MQTVGRRVRVRDEDGERVCFLSGRRAVVGDRVLWEEAAGSGGKLVEVLERDSVLSRSDHQGKQQVLAANLHGLFVVAAAQQPPYRPGLMDRYLVAAALEGFDVAILLTKTDLQVPDDVREDLTRRAEQGVDVIEVSNKSGDGLAKLTDFLAERKGQMWALVGHSGVGKTSCISVLLPSIDVGPVGELSEYWGTGQHTTTASRVYTLDSGAEIVDSPGIRTFLPGGLSSSDVRNGFPGLAGIRCRYRDCLHREGEDGCEAEATVSEPVMASYRRLLAEVMGIEDRNAHR